LDEAQAACESVLALEPEDGTGQAIAAGIALDRGESARAQELIAQALDRSPGDVYLLVIGAEIALQTQPLEVARSVVAAAVSAVRTNPLVFLETDVSQIEHKLAEREGSTPVFQSAEPVV